MNSAFRKLFSEYLILNETLAWVRPYNKNLSHVHAYLKGFKPLYLPYIALLLVVCIKMLKRFLSRHGNRQHTLGIRPLRSMKHLHDIVIEVHYAACYCGRDSKLIRRCKQLLDIYPAACNIPMHGHHYTPFLRVCWNGCAELISYMIRIGANIEATTDAGEGAIYLTTYSTIRKKSNDFGAIKILLSAGADVNVGRHDGLTPLELAILKGHRRLARWLARHGARIPGADTGDLLRP